MKFTYTIAVSIAQTIDIDPEAGEPVAQVLADAGHAAIIDGIRARVEAVRLDHPERGVMLTVRDVVVASDEWEG